VNDRHTEIDGEGAFWAVIGFAASAVVGVALRPLRDSSGLLENVVIVYVIVVALTAAIGGRMAGLASSLSAALAYTYFFTTPYQTLRIDSWEQVTTVVLLFVAGIIASLGGRVSRRASVAAREEAAALQLLNAVNLAAARGSRDLPDLAALPHLDEEGRIPSGHRRSVGGVLVLPAEGVVVDLVQQGRRVGSLVVVPQADHPLLRTTRMSIAAAAHALATIT
jgi:hypothetical protein